jgi:protein tyrosine/serine phosphatase
VGRASVPGARTPGALIELPAVPNLRDLGGWPVAQGGHVRWGQLYRSTQLDKLAGDDVDAFRELGIRTVYDLRTEAERSSRPDRLPDGVEGVPVDVFGVREEYLETAFEEMTEKFGTIDGYFGRGLGLEPHVLDALRSQLVEQD